ncbi:MAG TPA: transglutaminase-like domain-containing protein, partial [Blastocatellia bacterium]|nr:transglutaminase-like domain-containing protein [Blastocatellia bacterium]
EAVIKFKRSNVAAARAENPFRQDPIPDRHQAGRKVVLEGEKADEVRHLAYQLRRIAVDNRLTEYEEIQNTLDFVQDIPYAFDKDSIDRLTNQALGILDYWRFPIETLYDENGDCDCKAVLAAALFRLVGFRALLLVSFDPDIAHAAVAVEGAPDFPQTDFFTDNQGRRYYFCETTGDTFTVGEQPSPGFANRFEIISFD